ncbi:MAG: PAAR domain-containing protein [Deltaproteobacteria bacterium]|nr:PAAR domain-containing protein [Deltaproteobacteria bacterium]
MPSQGRLGDKSHAPVDFHGCPACPHSVKGPAVQGSPDVFVNKKPALRVGDMGIHTACCGPNTWVATSGSATVMINYRPAHRKGDMDTHCGGLGSLIDGSSDVIVGG